MKKHLFLIVIAGLLTACNNETTGERTDNTGTTTQPITHDADALYGKEWYLLSLNGNPIQPDTTFPKQAYIIFKNDKKTVSGTLGCNGFGGNITYSGNNGIAISDIVSTQMACPNLDIENNFSDALRNAASFSIAQHMLSLQNSKGEIIAQLETR